MNQALFDIRTRGNSRLYNTHMIGTLVYIEKPNHSGIFSDVKENNFIHIFIVVDVTSEIFFANTFFDNDRFYNVNCHSHAAINNQK